MMRDSANFKIQEGKDALGEKYSPYPESGSDDGDRPALMKQYDSNLEMMCMIGMWINGILNNFGYVILNTAAETIFPGKAGLVLFFNIVPGLMIKLAVPFFAHLISYRTKVIAVTVMALSSLIIVGTTNTPELKCFGIALMSISSCFGEVSFLAMSFNFPDRSVTYWSSGTGVSGVFGSAMFILMTRVFEFSPRTTLFGGAFLFIFYYVSFSVLVQPLLKGALASAEDVGGIRGTEDDDTTRMLTRTRPRSESKSRHYQRMNSVTSDDGDLGRTHRNNNSNGRNDTDANANAKADSSSLSPIPSEEPVPGNDRTLASSTPDDAFQTTSEHNHNDSLLQPLSPSSSTVDIISDDDEEDGARAGSSTSFADKAVEEMSLSEQFELIGTLKHFMIPLFWVYFGEYVINTGINPTLGFTSMTHTAFFEYASFTYQVGVFISRSSRSYIAIRQVYWFPILQMANVLLFLAQSIFGLVDLPYLWLTLVMWEGLLGGGTYVNVFHQVKTDTPKEYAEWGMGVVSLSDSFGIVLAAILSIYLECWLGEHNGVDTGGC